MNLTLVAGSHDLGDTHHSLRPAFAPDSVMECCLSYGTHRLLEGRMMMVFLRWGGLYSSEHTGRLAGLVREMVADEGVLCRHSGCYKLWEEMLRSSVKGRRS